LAPSHLDLRGDHRGFSRSAGRQARQSRGHLQDRQCGRDRRTGIPFELSPDRRGDAAGARIRLPVRAPVSSGFSLHWPARKLCAERGSARSSFPWAIAESARPSASLVGCRVEMCEWMAQSFKQLGMRRVMVVSGGASERRRAWITWMSIRRSARRRGRELSGSRLQCVLIQTGFSALQRASLDDLRGATAPTMRASSVRFSPAKTVAEARRGAAECRRGVVSYQAGCARSRRLDRRRGD